MMELGLFSPRLGTDVNAKTSTPQIKEKSRLIIPPDQARSTYYYQKAGR